ncbi:hypothetical protein ACW68H_20080 [Vibrio diabolicus]
MAIDLENYEGIDLDNGFFATGEEETFFWECKDRLVWYSLTIYKNNKVYKFGYRSSNKTELLRDLENLPEGCTIELIGIWTGQWYTKLFLLDKDIAIEKLKEFS